MALQCVCDKGHVYIQADVYRDWPDGGPACPECHVEWVELRVSKGEIRKAEDKTTVQVYADKHGIGIFEEGLHEDHGPMDLRLDDMDSFLIFIHDLLTASKEMGWFKKTSAQYTLK